MSDIWERCNVETILETFTFGYEQKLEASKHQIKIEGNHPYFNYAAK